jgi:hypothetical protein
MPVQIGRRGIRCDLGRDGDLIPPLAIPGHPAEFLDELENRATSLSGGTRLSSKRTVARLGQRQCGSAASNEINAFEQNRPALK